MVKPARRWKRPTTELVPRPAPPPPSFGEGGDGGTTGRVRLNRFLAMAGVVSRRAGDRLIAQGGVRLNGEVVRDPGATVDPLRDEVVVEGRRLSREKPVYVLLNKPKGVVCTNHPREKKVRAVDLVAHVKGRLFTVGRLDEETEGLLLLTNDGAFAQRVAHPRYGVPRTYGVLVRGRMETEDLQKVRGGVWLAEGRTGRTKAVMKKRGRDRTYLLVTLREGRNREIRRIFAKLGRPVLSIKRIRIGPLTLHGLEPGRSRFLKPHEVRALMAAGSGGAPQE